MSSVEKVSVALTHDMLALVKNAVSSGEYASTSEVIREALRTWQFKRKVESLELEELRRLIQEGVDSGPSIDAELVFSRLRDKYKSMDKQDDL